MLASLALHGSQAVNWHDRAERAIWATLHKLCSYISTIQSIGINCMSTFLRDRAWWIADLHYFSRLHFVDAWALYHADIPMYGEFTIQFSTVDYRYSTSCVRL